MYNEYVYDLSLCVCVQVSHFWPEIESPTIDEMRHFHETEFAKNADLKFTVRKAKAESEVPVVSLGQSCDFP